MLFKGQILKTWPNLSKAKKKKRKCSSETRKNEEVKTYDNAEDALHSTVHVVRKCLAKDLCNLSKA